MASTILVIDDDPSLVNLLKEDLEAEGYSVLEGYDGQTALELARSAQPQLIIMDVHMPGLDGPQVLEVLRSAEETRRIPVIFLTGESARSADAELDAAQNVTRLEKPVDFDLFNQLVRRLIQPS